MHQLKFKELPVMERHKCDSYRSGDWVIHECPKCDFELWDNLLTGDTKVINAKVNINHFGFYVSPEYYSTPEQLN